jgi:hypothetical protein
MRWARRGYIDEMKRLLVFGCTSMLCGLMSAVQADEIVSFDVIKSSGDSGASMERRVPLREASPLTYDPGDRIELRTAEGRSLDLTIQRVTRSTLGNYIIRSRDPYFGTSIIVIDGEGRALGSVEGTGASFEIVTNADGKSLLREKNLYGVERPIDFGAVEKPRKREALNEVSIDTSSALSEWPPRESQAAEADGEEVVYPSFQTGEAVLSILMYYDDSMSDATSRIDFVTTVANDAFSESNAGININIVAAKALSIDDEATLSDVLTAMSDAAAPFENIEADRNGYDADLVYAIKDSEPDDEDSCGIAYRGFPVDYGPYRDFYEGTVMWDTDASDGSTCDDITFAHEVGHSLGLQHDRETETNDEGEVDVAYYSYGFGFKSVGSWKTVMAYGTEPRLKKFSSPQLDCEGSPCGRAASESDSADSRSALRNSRHPVAAFSGDFVYESVRSYAKRGQENECTTSDDEEGFWRGVGIRNHSSHPVEVVSVHYQRTDRSYYVISYEPGEYVAQSGGNAGVGYCRSDSEDPVIGTSYVAGFVRYKHPESGVTVQTAEHEFSADYDGKYQNVRASAGSGGSVAGNTSLFARTGSSQSFALEPDEGYSIDSVTSSCEGELSGTTYTVNVAQDDCIVEATFSADQQSDAVFRLSLEEPVNGEIHSGVGNLRGWAVASSGITKVEILVDGAYAFDAPYGASRADVGGAFPDVDDSTKSGYSLAFAYSLLSAGEHTITAVAHSELGGTTQVTNTFNVVKFATSDYITDPDAVNLNSASCSVTDDEILLIDSIVDSAIYDVILKWRTAEQGFEIIEVR